MSIVAPCSQRPRGETMNATSPATSSGLPKLRDVELVPVMLDGRGLVEAGALHDDVEPVAEAISVDRAGIDRVHLHAIALADVGQRLMNASWAPITEEPIM